MHLPILNRRGFRMRLDLMAFVMIFMGKSAVQAQQNAFVPVQPPVVASQPNVVLQPPVEQPAYVQANRGGLFFRRFVQQPGQAASRPVSRPPSMSNTSFSNRWRADLKVSGRGFRP